MKAGRCSSWMISSWRPKLNLLSFNQVQYKDSGGVISFIYLESLFVSKLYLLIIMNDQFDCFNSLTCKVF